MRYIIITFCLLINSITHAVVVQRDFDAFTVWIDCEERGAWVFYYHAVPDTGNLPRKHSFYKDTTIPDACQATSRDVYSHPIEKFERGHLVPANHFDHDNELIKQTNIITNILPQTRTMNRGAWKRTENITDCYRDIEPTEVLGGVIWGDDANNDFFIGSHGIRTPDAYWKIIWSKNDLIAWIVPNIHSAKGENLDSYIVSVSDIEIRIDANITGIPVNLRNKQPNTSWELPANCSLQ